MSLPRPVVAPTPTPLELPPEWAPGARYSHESEIPDYQPRLDAWIVNTRKHAASVYLHEQQSLRGYPETRGIDPATGMSVIRTSEENRLARGAALQADEKGFTEELGFLLETGNRTDILNKVQAERSQAIAQANEAQKKHLKAEADLGKIAAAATVSRSAYLEHTRNHPSSFQKPDKSLETRAASARSAIDEVDLYNAGGTVQKTRRILDRETIDHTTLSKILDPFLQEHEHSIGNARAELNTAHQALASWRIGEADPSTCDAEAEAALANVNNILLSEMAAPDGRIYDSAAKELIGDGVIARFRLEQRRIAQDPSYRAAQFTPDGGIQFSDGSTIYQDRSINRNDGRGRRMIDGSVWTEQPLPAANANLANYLQRSDTDLAGIAALWQNRAFPNWERTRSPQARADLLAVVGPYLTKLEEAMYPHWESLDAIGDAYNRFDVELRDPSLTAAKRDEINIERNRLTRQYNHALSQLAPYNTHYNQALYCAQLLRVPKEPQARHGNNNQQLDYRDHFTEPVMHPNGGQEFRADLLNGFDDSTWILYPLGDAHRREDRRYYYASGRAA